MKRKKSATSERWFSLFNWKPCVKCKYEFRREFGYVQTVERYYGTGDKYVCSTCATSAVDADNIIAKLRSESDGLI